MELEMNVLYDEYNKKKRVAGTAKDVIELRQLKLFVILMLILGITDYLMPQYFGFHLGFDFTSIRIMNVALILYFMLNRKVGTQFVQMIIHSKLTLFILPYMFVLIYTTILRADVNTFFLSFLDFLTLYMLLFGIRYGIGIEVFLKWTVRCAYFWGTYGLVEFMFGYSLFHRFLSTVPNNVISTYRSGLYRIMGPCGHPLGYGLFLIILIALVCIDYKKDEIYLFKRPVLIVLLFLNVMLTGSRSTLGIVFLEFALIFLFSNRINIKKTLLVLCAVLLGLCIFELLFFNTGIGRYIMMQLTSVIDQVFGTQYAAGFGADVITLENSEAYRKMLLKIFELDWLNPLIGRGVKGNFSVEIEGTHILSIDNFYVAQYIRYAYPGLIAYIFFIVGNLIMMLWAAFKYKSGLCKAIFIASLCYFVNLWWLDTLQTIKYEYIAIAIFYAFCLQRKNIEKYKRKKMLKLEEGA